MSNLSAASEHQVRQLARRHGLESLADDIVANAAECYSLFAAEEDDYEEVGNTRFGGNPDLPEEFEWPTDAAYGETKYANFIGQINFAELPKLGNGSPLPAKGLLSIFVRSMDGASLPVQLSSFYFPTTKSLELRESPDEEELCDEYLVDLVPQRITAKPSVSVARFRKEFQKKFEDAHHQKFWEFADALSSGEAIGQMLGFANAGDERENLYRQVVLAQLNQRNLVYNDYWDTLAEYEEYIEKYRQEKSMYADYLKMRPGVEWLNTNRELIADQVAQWRLLWRLNSNDDMNLNINDADPLYVFVKNQDLASREFSNLAGEVTQG